MFLTRSIRRKLVVGMTMVGVMLAALAFSGIVGLVAFRNVVLDLDRQINHAPRRDLLVDAVGVLPQPLLLLDGTQEKSSEALRAQHTQMQELLAAAEGELHEFRYRLEKWTALEGGSTRRMAIDARLGQIELNLRRLKHLLPGLQDAELHRVTTAQMLRLIATLQVAAQGLKDPQDGVNSTLRKANPVYRSLFWVLFGTAAVAVVLFIGLITCGLRWIFTPIRKLHQGASRVAQGDFDFRLEIVTNDEMAELAESFNKMTERFQETAADLDRQVRERSKQLVRSERLAGIGFLAAGVAHEINNPLAAVAMATESLESRISPLLEHCDESERVIIPQYLEMIQREAFRCQQITARLLDFSRGQDTTRGRHDLTSIINEVITLVRHMSKFRNREITFSQTSPVWLEINGPEIRQVVLNLVANALESMEDGDKLEIRMVQRTDDVEVTFSDTGCGMTAETLENLFEPFFTRRKSGKGTGLGLSISHRIVSDHGGRIEARSDGPGTGSAFRVHLPLRAEVSESGFAA